MAFTTGKTAELQLLFRVLSIGARFSSGRALDGARTGPQTVVARNPADLFARRSHNKRAGLGTWKNEPR